MQESCIETTYTFVQDGSVETRAGLHWVYTVGEIRQLLSDAGLETVDVFGSHAGEPFDVGSPLLIVIAQKE